MYRTKEVHFSMDKITHINLVLKDFFDLNKAVSRVVARDMMPYFVLAGVFANDQEKGLPILHVLRKLDNDNQLQLIPYAFADRKSVYTKWFFVTGTHSVTKIVGIQQKIVKDKLKKRIEKKKIVKKNKKTK